MTTILEITDEDIEALTDGDLRELVARLCCAELRAQGLPVSAVTWGGNQTDPDGGIDVRVSLDQATKISGFVPKPQSGFQVKAQDMPRGEIVDEMKPGGQLRPSILRLAENKGSYIIVSSKGSLADAALTTRQTAMRDCLNGEELSHELTLDFYDRRRLRTCVEAHPSLVTWVRAKAGRPIAGWKSYGSWSSGDTAGSEYILDEKVKLFTPGQDEGLDIQSAFDKLRSELSAPRKSIRLIGLSGVGKTRLVQALFDGRVEGLSEPLDINSVVYTDLSDNPDPQPQALVDALLERRDRCIVVVDNCGADLHQRLTEKVCGVDSALSLITIEYDIRDDIPESTTCYRLEPSTDELIKALLERHYPAFNHQDIETIAAFSGGNARVAFALANTSSQGGELSKLNDEQLFQRLFEQSHAASEELLVSGEVCSLLYSFDGLTLTGDEAELPLLAGLGDLTAQKLYRHVENLRRRGLVQTRGKWRAVLPHAIANRLAQRALRNIPVDHILKCLVESGSVRIQQSFSRRLGYLHDEPIAQSIVKGWLAPGGLLGELGSLDPTGVRMFRNVAPVDPVGALIAVSRAASDGNFVAVTASNRQQFARLVRQIGYDSDHFEGAVNCLILFAEVELPDHKNDPAREMVSSLFFSHLSGTVAPIALRAKIVREFLGSAESRRVEIGISCLNSALEAEHFSSHYEFDFGSRKRSYGWWPRTRDDVVEWYSTFSEVALEAGNSSSECLDHIKVIFANRFRGLWARAGLYDRLEQIARALHSKGGWPAGWRAVRKTLANEKNQAPEVRQRLAKLEDLLRPTNLIDDIRARAFAQGIFDDGIDEDGNEEEEFSVRYKRHQSKLAELGRQLAVDRGAFEVLSADLVSSNATNVWYLAEGVGDTCDDPVQLLNLLKGAFEKTTEDKRSLSFVVSFIEGAVRKHPEALSLFLDRCVSDPVFGPYFPNLQSVAMSDPRAVDRLMESIRGGRVPAFRYRALAGGRATDPLSVTELVQLLTAIRDLGRDGAASAFDIAHMVVFVAKEKDEAYRSELRDSLGAFLTAYDWMGVEKISEHEVNEVFDFTLPGTTFEGLGASLLAQITTAYAKNQYKDYGIFLAPLLKYFPSAVLDTLIGEGSSEKYTRAIQLIHRNSDFRGSLLDAADAKLLLAWAGEDPKIRIPFLAAASKPFHKINDTEYAWTDLSLSLLKAATDKGPLLRELASRVRPSSWSGSRAMIIKKRTDLIAGLPGFLLGIINQDDVEPYVKDLTALAEREYKAEQDDARRRDERFE